MFVMKKRELKPDFIIWVLALALFTATVEVKGSVVLNSDSFKHYVDAFNENNEELYIQHISKLRPTDAAHPPAIVTCTSTYGASAGWGKYDKNPVLGGDLGTCFDLSVLKEKSKYRMWFSWRPKESIALVESDDGIYWGKPEIMLGPNPNSTWEDRVNRPVVVKHNNMYHIWYTGQTQNRSWIGYAISSDCHNWKRVSDKPVLSPEQPWENMAVMCPHVLWDEKDKLYHIWYSAGEQYEPNAIGYATSSDGLDWTKWKANPIFVANHSNQWEQHKVTGCQVIRHGQWYLMFYIGFRDEHHAQIGLARSKDGVTDWHRHSENPIVFPTEGSWDGDACYKPFAIYEPENNRWLLWYNGRKGTVEQIGLAIHCGEDLGF